MGDRPDGLSFAPTADSSFAPADLSLLQLQFPGIDPIVAAVSPPGGDVAAIDPAALAPPSQHESATAGINDVVFIDARVPDLQDLLNGLKPGEKAFIIDSGSDGLDQIASILKTEHLGNLTGIQIVSHGAAGALELGATMLNDADLSLHANALAIIGSALAKGGDLSLYACDTAAGTTGQQFIADLSHLTGAIVAAATHDVGSAALGGSWTLDASTGPVSPAATSAPFTDAALSAFHDVLPAAPVVSLSGIAETYTGGGAAQPLDPGITLSDSSSTTLESATVSIEAGSFLYGDLLNFTDQNGIRGSYDPFGGALTLIGHATLAQYQTALQSITYSDGNNDPTGGGSHTSRAIDWVVNDGTLSSAVATSTIATKHLTPVVMVDTIPVPTFLGGGAAVPLDAGLTVIDVGNLIGASVQLVGHLNGDTLNFTNTSHIQGSYNSTTGVLTLSGTDTVADYQAALDSVTYSFSPANGDPTFGGTQTSRSVYWVVNDGNTVNGTNEIPASSARSFNNDQPTIGLDQFVVLQGLFPGHGDGTTDSGGIPLGAIRTSAAEFVIPWGGTVEADGQQLPINANAPLFSVLFDNYGGNGTTAFGLPGLQGRIAVGNEGSLNNQLGQSYGSDNVTLTTANQPQRWGGGGQPFNNDQPSQVVNYIINTAGGIPGNSGNTADLLGEVVPFLGNYAPAGYLFAAG